MNGFQEIWYLKMNDPTSGQALFLQFLALASQNGFRRISSVTAVHFQNQEGGKEPLKTALQQQFELRALKRTAMSSVSVGECSIQETLTRGSLQNKGNSLKWDLQITQANPTQFNLIPEGLTKFKVSKIQATTEAEDLRFNGWTEVNGQRVEWKGAFGMRGHIHGTGNIHSWVWSHCNSFVNERSEPEYFVFEGLSAKACLAKWITSPQISTFYFYYQGQEYRFNTVLDALRSRSQTNHNEWKFEVDKKDISFKGQVRAEHRDFAGLSLEDIDGSILYGANALLADLTIWVYRRGKLEATLKGKGTAALEMMSRNRNPYVQLLI